MGHCDYGALIAWLFNDNVNFAFAQRTFKQGQHTDFLGKGFDGCGRGRAYEQINVTTLFCVVHAGTEEPDSRTIAKRAHGCGANCLDLVRG